MHFTPLPHDVSSGAMSQPPDITVAREPFVTGAVLASARSASSHDAAMGRVPHESHARLDGRTHPFAHLYDQLHDDERALMQTMAPAVQSTFAAGRAALRAAMRQVSPGHAPLPVLRATRGAPQLPSGLAASISHKRTRAVAFLAPLTDQYVGVDIELRPTEHSLTRPSIAPRVLTDTELQRLESLGDLAHREATLVHFALKEAVYKAIDPYVQRYVQFTEVELDVRENGDAVVQLRMPDTIVQNLHVRALWRFEGDWIVAMALSTNVTGVSK